HLVFLMPSHKDPKMLDVRHADDRDGVVNIISHVYPVGIGVYRHTAWKNTHLHSRYHLICAAVYYRDRAATTINHVYQVGDGVYRHTIWTITHPHSFYLLVIVVAVYYSDCVASKISHVYQVGDGV